MYPHSLWKPLYTQVDKSNKPPERYTTQQICGPVSPITPFNFQLIRNGSEAILNQPALDHLSADTDSYTDPEDINEARSRSIDIHRLVINNECHCFRQLNTGVFCDAMTKIYDD